MKINNLLGQYGGATATHLTAKGYKYANQMLDMLCSEQEATVAAGGTALTAIPLAWVALASSVGLTVDREGRIVLGPRSTVARFAERPQRAPIGHRRPEEMPE